MTVRKAVPIDNTLSISFLNGRPVWSGAQGLSKEEIEGRVGEWISKAEGKLDEIGAADAVRMQLAEQIAFTQAWLAAIENQEESLRNERILDNLVEGLLQQDACGLMKERRDPATGTIMPPVPRDEAKAYYERLAKSILTIKQGIAVL